MSLPLRILLTATDVGFIIYWSLAAMMAANLINIPTEYMYADASNPRVIAWNWSFFPLDIVFSIVGLAAIRRASQKDESWRYLALISMVLTMTAGGMAVTYWALLSEFNPSWFTANLLLLIWPLFFFREVMQLPKPA